MWAHRNRYIRTAYYKTNEYLTSMLQYTSLVLCVIIVDAYYIRDTIIHQQWLAVLCTSLINHTSKYSIKWVGLLDRVLCHSNAAYCVWRMYSAPKVLFNNVLITCNCVMGVYIMYIYHIGKLCDRHPLYHGSMHFVSTIIVLNVMHLEAHT